MAAGEALAADPRFALHSLAPSTLPHAVKAEIKRGTRRILVAGGDGTVAAAASEAVGRPVQLAILPGGTLNHFAKDYGIPLDPREALEVAAGTAKRRVDVGFVNDRLFLNTSSVGAYVSFVHRRDRLEPHLGYRLGSLVAALRILARLRSYRIELQIEGKIRRYRTPLVFIGVDERDLRLPIFGSRMDNGQSGLQRSRSRPVSFPHCLPSTHPKRGSEERQWRRRSAPSARCAPGQTQSQGRGDFRCQAGAAAAEPDT